MPFTAKIWNNGRYHATGAGYGIKILFEDRERYFDRTWQTVVLHLSGFDYPIEVNVAKPSFWNRTCGELIKKEIGVWYLSHHPARWNRGNSPQVIIKPLVVEVFSVEFT